MVAFELTKATRILFMNIFALLQKFGVFELAAI